MHDSYQEQVSKLSLPLLVYRRSRGDMIYLYQLINIDANDFFKHQTFTITRGHKYKIYKPYAKCFCRAHFFMQRTINKWNSLPEIVVESPTINLFKNSLDA